MTNRATLRVAPILLAAFALVTPLHAFFPEWIRTSQVSVTNGVRPLTADFNGDGRADLVVQTSYYALRLFITNSDGTVGTSTILYQGDYLSNTIVGDVDGDGRKDVITTDIATNTIIVLLSNGDGTFGVPVKTPVPIAPTEIASGDFDGDGKLDLVIRSYSADLLAVYSGDGAGHFSEVHREPLPNAPYRLTVGDLDGDGKLDVVVSENQPVGHSVRFGRGDGSFDAPMSVPSAPAPSSSTIVADLNGDGLLEILSTQFDPNTVTVVRNLSGRTFATADSYLVVPHTSNPYDYDNYGNPVNLAVSDFNEDGKPDLVVSLANIKQIGTLFGNGDGTFGGVMYSFVQQPGGYTSFFPTYLTLADFDGDGIMEIAVSSSTAIQVLKNSSGGVTVTLQTIAPTIATGQNATFTVRVSQAAGFGYAYNHLPPSITGTVTLMQGTDILGVGTLSGSAVTIDVPSLAAGGHTITAVYSGDANYRAITSAPVTQNVVAEQTTVTITANPAGRELAFGESLLINATATSPIPGALQQSSFWLYTDGVRSTYTGNGWSVFLATGTHTLYAAYPGDATHPPANSDILTIVVHKAGSVTAIETNLYVIQNPAQPSLHVSLRGNPFGGTPGGDVSLYDGSILLNTVFADNRCCSGGMSVDIPLQVLSPGVHYIHASYAGNSNFLPSQSANFRLQVVPAGTFVIDAQAGPSWIIVTGFYNAPPAVTHYQLRRRIGSGPWTAMPWFVVSQSYSEDNPQSRTVYTYQVNALDSSNNVVAASNTELAMLVAFTDDPATQGMTLKALHLSEVISATNVLRAAAGLSAFSLSDAGVGQTIRAAHFVAIGNAINEARVALGAPPVPFASDITAGSVIRAQHLQDLREAMR